MEKLKKAAFTIIFSVATVISPVVQAQQSQVYTHENSEFNTGLELFQKEKYGAAQKSFRKVIESHPAESLVRIDAEYYNAICATELFNKDGELYLKQFVADHPESPKVKSAYFYLGKYNYRKKKWRDAIDWFQKVSIYDLTTDELAEFYFKRGYSYFMTEKYAEAKKDLFEIKDVDNTYAGPAKYYYAHIAYLEKNYETALTDFLKLQQNETFGPIVPYYIAQLYYLQGKYEQVISYAPALLDSANTKRGPEIARVLGESYYRTNRFAEAIPLLQRYEKGVGALSRSDNYQLGYAFYKVNKCDEAISYFVKVTNVDDSLVQNAYYHLGDCYLRLDNKQNARHAFGQASKMNFDKAIHEDALFNYAKLCYELAYNPYNEAIKAFQEYIRTYPGTSRTDEAYTFLVNVFTTSKNYKDALSALESVKVLTPELKQAHQKIAYYRGVDLFNNAEYKEAITLFNKATTYTFDKNVSALAVYWKGEAFYRMADYEKAINSYQAFITEPGSIAKSEYSDANYNIAYSFYKLKDYDNSILWFRKFVTFKPQADAKKINDALNRIGDGYFMTRDFTNAADYYGQSFRMKLINADYALFQRALAYGVQKKYTEKINDLKLFISTYGQTSSTFTERAKYELGLVYTVDNRNDLALSTFKKFIDEYPNSQFVNGALSKIGLIYYNKKDDDNALIYFDKLIRRNRKSAESNEAIAIVTDIYTAKGDIPGLQSYLGSIGASIPQAALDSLAYSVGLKLQDCKDISPAFDKYIQQFPDGIFIIEASYYKAECDFQMKNTDAALTAYLNVVKRNKSQFTERSLVRICDIYFRKQDFAQAVTYYKQLEEQALDPKNISVARIGLMKSYAALKDDVNATDYARKVLQTDKLSSNLSDEAHYIIAQSYMNAQKYDDAYAEFKALANSSKSEYGAEAGYNVAYLLFLKNDFKQSEKAVFDFINNNGDYPYWVTKALILLADDYAAMNDNFQARTTLKSVISDSDIPELIKIAQEKLDKLNAAEEAAKQAKMKGEQPIELEFKGNSPENNLFNEPVQTPEGDKKDE
jgi:TolA-binding protein